MDFMSPGTITSTEALPSDVDPDMSIMTPISSIQTTFWFSLI